ncbi:TPA: hypothetical protein N0F65_005753 [Lagenidium giganteum]|uniref:Uncharacterized protein n=1 Tax=Lagenidium giganteum TaxID=4803 RepID=A0AAV2YZ38_9STRA|nr:TPA: hypothetical protein N0F65_005753 [Lagenidium giganteum]
MKQRGKRNNGGVTSCSSSSDSSSAPCTPSETVVDHELKKKEHRENMVQFRKRKKASITGARELHARLEKRLAYLLATRHDLRHQLHDSLTFHRLRYAELVAPTETIRRENEALREHFMLHAKYTQVLHEELMAIYDSDKENVFVCDDQDLVSLEAAHGRKELRGQWIHFTHNEPPFFYLPFPEEACAVMVRQAYEEVRKMQMGFQRKEFRMWETKLFGWTAQRSLVRNERNNVVSRVLFRKRYDCGAVNVNEKLDEVRTMSWRLHIVPDMYQRCHRTPIISKVLQSFGDHTFIIVRNTPDPCTINIRYLNLVSSIETTTALGQRRSMLTMSVAEDDEHRRIREADGRTDVIWLTEGYAFVEYTAIDDHTLEVSYGNQVECVSEEQAQYFMLELPPRFIEG